MAEKTAATTVAAVAVRIGLLCALVEKAQVLSPFHITEVTLYAAEASDYELTSRHCGHFR